MRASRAATSASSSAIRSSRQSLATPPREPRINPHGKNEFSYGAISTSYASLSPPPERLQWRHHLYERTSDGEADGEREHRYRIHAAGRQVAQVTLYELAGEITEDAVQYLHSDALGSPEVITDENGDLVDRRAFDPFGKLEAGDLPGTPSVSTGFTGHEHDTELGWINMGGRIYDPTVARFLTPDPIIQAPYSSQGLNAYSYVFNNPLNLTDPTGFQAIDEFGRMEILVCGSNRPAGCENYGKDSANTSGWYSPEAFGIGALGPPQAPRPPVAETLPVPRSVGQQFADLTVEVLGGIAQGVVCGLLGCGDANAPIKGQPTVSAMSEGEKLMNSAFTAAGVVGVGMVGRAGATPARAGSGLGPWVPASGVTSGGAVAQSLPGSCGAACVEMLTGGAISEAAAIGRMGQYILPSQMVGVLGRGWGYRYFNTGADAVAAASRTPIAAGLFAPGVKTGHIVVLERTMTGFVVRDPLPGVTYRVGADWVTQYVAWGVGPFL